MKFLIAVFLALLFAPVANSAEPTSWLGFRNPPPYSLDPGWRPFSDAAAWNIGTAGATVHPNSAAMVNYLQARVVQNIVVGSQGSEYGDGSAVYFADTDDPVYQINCVQWTSSCEIHGDLIRIPMGAKPPPIFTDKHMTIVQPDGMAYCTWQSSVPMGGGTFTISHGGKTRIDGDSTGTNCTAGQTDAMAGEIRSTQWIAGTINHAIGLTVLRTALSPTSVYPVREQDCGSHAASQDASSPIPNGQWFKLNLTDSQLATYPPWQRTIYRAMRDYGGFVIDTGGAGFSYSHGNEMTYGSYGQKDPAHDWLIGQPGVVIDSSGRAVARTTNFPFQALVALNPPPALPCGGSSPPPSPPPPPTPPPPTPPPPPPSEYHPACEPTCDEKIESLNVQVAALTNERNKLAAMIQGIEAIIHG